MATRTDVRHRWVDAIPNHCLLQSDISLLPLLHTRTKIVLGQGQKIKIRHSCPSGDPIHRRCHPHFRETLLVRVPNTNYARRLVVANCDSRVTPHIPVILVRRYRRRMEERWNMPKARRL